MGVKQKTIVEYYCDVCEAMCYQFSPRKIMIHNKRLYGQLDKDKDHLDQASSSSPSPSAVSTPTSS